MSDVAPKKYTVRQYFYDKRGERNEDVHSYDDLLTHHPMANFNANIKAGVLKNVEKPHKRSHAFIGGEFQEIEAARTDEYSTLEKNQILLVKDFILEDSGKRAVDVPSPIAGYVGRVDSPNGLIEIHSEKNGHVIARVRHLNPISVKTGDTVEYGESLGRQNNQGLNLPAGKDIHVHVEVDTRYHQQLENYIADLVSGRLSIQAEYRKDIQPLSVIDDGIMRLGESGERVAAVQRALVADNYRAVGDKPIEIDGVYRPSMQGAVLAFQQDHRIPQTGDIDPATYQLALRVNLDKTLGPVERQLDLSAPDVPLFRQTHDLARGLDSEYTPTPHRALSKSDFEDPARTGRAPQYHDHPDHRITPAMPPLMQAQAAFQSQEFRFYPHTPEDDYLDAFLDAAERGDYAARRTLTDQYDQLPHVQALQQETREAMLAEQQRLLEEQLRQEQERQRLMQQRQQEQEHSRSHGFSR